MNKTRLRHSIGDNLLRIDLLKLLIVMITELKQVYFAIIDFNIDKICEDVLATVAES